MRSPRTGNNPKAWNRLHRTLKRSQLRQARKEVEPPYRLTPLALSEILKPS